MLLLAVGLRACSAARFAVPVVRAIGAALVATVPMALAVSGVADTLLLALAVGIVTYAATLAAASAESAADRSTRSARVVCRPRETGKDVSPVACDGKTCGNRRVFRSQATGLTIESVGAYRKNNSQ